MTYMVDNRWLKPPLTAGAELYLSELPPGGGPKRPHQPSGYPWINLPSCRIARGCVFDKNYGKWADGADVLTSGIEMDASQLTRSSLELSYVSTG